MSEDVRDVWLQSSDNFCHCFRSLDLVIFGLKAFRHKVSCERNPSHSLSQIFLKLCMCFCQGFKMRMVFDCNLQINL